MYAPARRDADTPNVSGRALLAHVCAHPGDACLVQPDEVDGQQQRDLLYILRELPVGYGTLDGLEYLGGDNELTLAAELLMSPPDDLDDAARIIGARRPADSLPRAVCALHAPPAEPIEWAVADLWTRGDLGIFAGEGGSLKSTAGLALAAAVAGGYAAFNRFPTERRPVLILSAEDPAPVIFQRLEALVVGHGWDRDRVRSNVHVIASEEASIASPAWREHLHGEAARIKPGVIMLDPWAELIEGNESDNSEQRATIKFVRALAAASGACPLIVHHASKPAEGKKLGDRIRGASALFNASRVAFFFDARADGVHVTHLKMSRAAKLPPFVLRLDVETDPHNRATWRSARLTCKDEAEVQATDAESFVLAQLDASPGMGSTELRKAAVGSGVSAKGVGEALKTLEERGRIEYDAGPNNAKQWRVKACPTHSAGLEIEPAKPAHGLPGRLTDTTSEPAHPFRGGRLAQSERVVGRLDVPRETYACAGGCGRPFSREGITCLTCRERGAA